MVTGALELHVPSRPELAVRRRWLADPEMMAYNAGWDVAYPGYDRATGCIDWPESQWSAFEARLRLPASTHGYYFVREPGTDEFVGHAHYEVDPHGTASVGINIVPSVRGRGFGVRALDLLVERVWRDTDAREITNEFEDERTAAASAHRRCGFVPDPVTSTAWGRATRTWRLRRPAT